MSYLGEAIFLDRSKDEFINKLISNKFTRYYILTDDNTSVNCLPVFTAFFKDKTEFHQINIPAGEEYKSIQTLEFIWQQMEDADRNSVLINLGGGVITDTGGLAASLFKRGMKFVNVPTTLLAMVDAAVGGKTGVNFHNLKNHIGLFSDAFMTYLNPEFFKTLPRNQYNSGIAEIIKIGFISDKNLYLQMESLNDMSVNQIIIERSVRAKINIVAKDKNEKSIRKLLNFGHTIGHAVESFTLDHWEVPLLHGEAIAFGMVVESYIAVKSGFLKDSEFENLMNLLKKVFIIKGWKKLNFKDILPYLIHDKKNLGKQLNFSLPVSVGKGVINQYPNPELVEDSFKIIGRL